MSVKIDLYGKDDKGNHHYLYSTNMFKLVREAVARFHQVFDENDQTIFYKKFGTKLITHTVYGRKDKDHVSR